MNTLEHAKYMSLALRLAKKGRFSVSPNPMVGCVIVKNNQIIGKGFHQCAGGPHAEISALQQAGKEAKDASVYVTLEPCCHYGRTPPCANALIEAGVSNVYISCLDPNPLVRGKGIQQLQSDGISVNIGLFEKESITLNEIFFHYITHRRPFVIAKWAMSLDGKTTTHALDDKQISGESSKKITHKIRQHVDAILVGANTVLVDNPQLTVRNNTSIKQPIRIILAGKKYFPNTLNIFKDLTSKIIIAGTKQTQQFISHLQSNHIEILILPENKQNRVHLPTLLSESIQIINSYKAGEDFHFISDIKEYANV
jgi:diaminohydroxyphosphoribosylaminopyrimidine deaminase/5-amino-6-(5-phosphoribosylamino)uracil reductase